MSFTMYLTEGFTQTMNTDVLKIDGKIITEWCTPE